MRIGSRGRGRWRSRLAAACAVAGWLRALAAQEPTAADLPAPSPAPSSPADAQLLERLRRMEERLDRVTERNEELSRENQRLRRMEERLDRVTERNEELSRENRRLSDRYEELSRTLRRVSSGEGGSGGGPGQGAASERPAGRGEPPAGRTGTGTGGGGGDEANRGSSRSGEIGATGEAQVVGNRRRGILALKAGYDDDAGGFLLESEDGELQLRIRGLLQADARIYPQANQDPVSGGFYIPRARVYFTGRVTRAFDYQASFEATNNALNILNLFLDYSIDERFHFRFGRMVTPYTYEFYRLQTWNLLAPERSLYNVNFQGNRQVGLMGWGDLLGRRLNYAVGAFDGQRNSYVDFNHSPDVMAFVNLKPFEAWADSPWRNVNVGGSVDGGHEDNPLAPSVLRTTVQPNTNGLTSQTTDNLANVPFLAFNQDVRERGERALWELHAAYYAQGLSVLGAWDGGINSYSRTGPGHAPVPLPVGGYFIQVGYIVTGETADELTLIDPLHPFDLRRGKFGLGAIQPTARFSTLHLGKEVFTRGLADPNLWTNNVSAVDVGLNWYLNRWVKLYLDWQHAVFGQPVYYRPGPGLQKTSDLFWCRFQVYF